MSSSIPSDSGPVTVVQANSCSGTNSNIRGVQTSFVELLLAGDNLCSWRGLIFPYSGCRLYRIGICRVKMNRFTRLHSGLRSGSPHILSHSCSMVYRDHKMIPNANRERGIVHIKRDEVLIKGKTENQITWHCGISRRSRTGRPSATG